MNPAIEDSFRMGREGDVSDVYSSPSALTLEARSEDGRRFRQQTNVLTACLDPEWQEPAGAPGAGSVELERGVSDRGQTLVFGGLCVWHPAMQRQILRADAARLPIPHSAVSLCSRAPQLPHASVTHPIFCKDKKCVRVSCLIL